MKLKPGESTNRGRHATGSGHEHACCEYELEQWRGVYGLEYMIRDRTRVVLKKTSTWWRWWRTRARVRVVNGT
jgi:hypothetical protein